MEYKVYAEFYGKKIKKTVWADCPEHAKEKLRSDIIFHKILTAEESVIFDNLMSLFKDRKLKYRL